MRDKHTKQLSSNFANLHCRKLLTRAWYKIARTAAKLSPRMCRTKLIPHLSAIQQYAYTHQKPHEDYGSC